MHAANIVDCWKLSVHGLGLHFKYPLKMCVTVSHSFPPETISLLHRKRQCSNMVPPGGRRSLIFDGKAIHMK